MQVVISAFHQSQSCTWCEKQTEAVTVEFYGGFLQNCALCWKCLQQAIRVHHRQEFGGESAETKKAAGK